MNVTLNGVSNFVHLGNGLICVSGTNHTCGSEPTPPTPSSTYNYTLSFDMHELFSRSVITEMHVYDPNTDDENTFTASNYEGTLRDGTDDSSSGFNLEIQLYEGTVQQQGTLHILCPQFDNLSHKGLYVSSSGQATISPSLWGKSSFESGKTYNFYIAY